TGPAGPQAATGAQGPVGPPGGFALLNLGRATLAKNTVSAGGAHSSTVSGSDGYPLVAVFDGANNRLVVVHCTDPTCSSPTSTPVDSSTPNMGRYPSVTIGSDGLGIVRYLGGANPYLRGARSLHVARARFHKRT